MHWLVVVQSVAFITKERSVLSLYSNHLPGTWRNSLRWRVISHSAKRKHSRYSEVWCCNCKLCIILEHASSTFFRDCPFLGRRILLGHIETFLQWNGEIYWDSHDIKWNKCISHRDQKPANYHCHFEWQPVAFHLQQNLWLIGYHLID